VRDYDVRDGDLSRAAHQALFDDYEGPKRKLEANVDPTHVDDVIQELAPTGARQFVA